MSVVGTITTIEAISLCSRTKLGWVFTNPRCTLEMHFQIRLWHQLAFWRFTSFHGGVQQSAPTVWVLLARYWLQGSWVKELLCFGPRLIFGRQAIQVSYPRCCQAGWCQVSFHKAETLNWFWVSLSTAGLTKFPCSLIYTLYQRTGKVLIRTLNLNHN